MTIAEQVAAQWELQGAAWNLCVALYGVDAIAVYAESLADVQVVPSHEQCMALTCDCTAVCKRHAAGLPV